MSLGAFGNLYHRPANLLGQADRQAFDRAKATNGQNATAQQIACDSPDNARPSARCSAAPHPGPRAIVFGHVSIRSFPFDCHAGVGEFHDLGRATGESRRALDDTCHLCCRVSAIVFASPCISACVGSSTPFYACRWYWKAVQYDCSVW